VLERVTELTPQRLAALGARGLLLDLDNTLLPPKDPGPVPEGVRRWVQELKDRGVRIALVANARPRRVRQVAAALGVPGAGPVAKPLPFGFLWGLRALGLGRDEVLAVGDQVFTDLLGARLAGLRFALVRPLAEDALPHTRWLRRLERRCLEAGGSMKARPSEEGRT